MLTTQNTDQDPEPQTYPKPDPGSGPNRDTDSNLANPPGDPPLTKADAERIDKATADQIARNLNIHNKEHVNFKIHAFVKDLQAQCPKGEGFDACQAVLDQIGDVLPVTGPKLHVLYGDNDQQDKLAKEAADRQAQEAKKQDQADKRKL